MRIIALIIFSFSIYFPTISSADSSRVFTQPIPDTNKFRCKYCPEDMETNNFVDTAVVAVADNNSKFSEYRGYDAKSVLPLFSGQYQLINDQHFFAVSVANIGTSNKEANLELRQYGRYQFDVSYDQISRFQSDSSNTIYQDVRSDSLTLPDVNNSDPVNDTEDVVTLYGVGSQYDIKQERNRFDVGFTKNFSSNWEGRINYQYENKKGLKTFGGAFGVNYNTALSVILPEPVDYVTQVLKLSIGIYRSRVKFEGGIKGSLFNNANSKTSWNNVYINNSTNEALKGQVSLAPDNQYYQIYALDSVQPLSWITLKAQLSAGRMKQDENYLPYTVNDNISTTDLPANSLNGSVNTLTGNFRLSMKPTVKTHISANISLDRKDNKTKSESYHYVALDSAVSNNSPVRSNLPYGYRTYLANIATDYYYKKGSFVGVGYQYAQKSRTYSEVGKTKTNQIWGKVKHKLSVNSNVSMKLEYAKRKASDFSLIPQITPPQNPLMRKFYLADKNRQKLGFNFSSFIMSAINLDISLDYAKDDYSKSVLGVVDANDFSYGVDVSQLVSESISVNAFIHGEKIESNQKGIDFNLQNWKVKNIDNFTTIGLGFDWKEVTEKFDMGSKLTMAYSTGKINPERNDLAQTDFPELKSSRASLEVYGRYVVKENMIVKAQYIIEKYEESDWHYDEVTATTLGRVLGTQQVTRDYLAQLVVVSLMYEF